MKRAGVLVFAAVVAVAISAPAMGAAYSELIPWSTVQAGAGGTSHWSHVVDGQTSYHTVNLSNSPAITKVSNLNGTQTSSVLVTSAAWYAASGQTSMANANGFGISNGTDLMWTDTGSDAVWKANMGTGAITEYVSKAQIMAHTGQSSAGSLGYNGVAPNGEFVWYESSSDCLLMTTGAGTLTTLVSDTELLALMGDDTVNGGIDWDLSGNLYFADSLSDSIYMRASNGTLSKALDVADIIAVTGQTAAGFGDIFCAPNGRMFFYESTADSILAFWPGDPANTLRRFRSETQLLNGPMGSDNVVTLGWYDGNLTFHTYGENGLFVTPEPTSLSLLGLGALAVLRRRR